MKTPVINVLRLAALSVLVAAMLCPGARAETPADKIVPPDAFLLVEVKSVDELVAKFKKTSTYGLYKDPAMQKFIGPAQTKIEELIEEGVSRAWKDMGIADPPKKMVYRPKGRVVLAVRMVAKVVDLPKWGMVDGEFKVVGTRQQKKADAKVVVLADMGDSAKAFGEMLNKLVAAAVDKGWQREKQTVRGADVITITSPKRAKPEGAPAWMPNPPRSTFCYVFKGGEVVAGTDIKLLKDVLVRMGGGEMASFGDDGAYKDTSKALGAGYDVSLYLNVKTLLAFAKTMDDSSKEKIDAQIRALGVDGVTGIAVAVSVAPNPREDLRVKALVGIRGERRGLTALLTPITGSTKPGAMLTKGLAAFMVANYDLGKVYDEIVKIVQAMAGMNLNEQLAGLMMMTGEQGENARPPVDFRTDVLGHLTAPLTLTYGLTRPYTAPDAGKVSFAIGVRDADALDAAIGRIHGAFFGGGEGKFIKQLLKTNIYMLPIGPGIFFGRRPRMLDPGAGGNIALSVVGQNLMIASLDTVEQAVRSLKRNKKTEGIELDPMYRHAAKFLPQEAGIFFYANSQISNEASWEHLREAASQAPTTTAPARLQGNHPLLRAVREKLGDAMDLSALPPFDSVKKYFGPVVGYVKSTDRGLLMEFISIKAPKE